KLYRSDPDDKSDVDYKDAIRPVIQMVQTGANRPLTVTEVRQLDENIQKMAASTGMTESYVRSQAQIFDQNMRTMNQVLIEKAGVGGTRTQEISTAIMKQTRGIPMSSEEKSALERDLKVWAQETGRSMADLQPDISRFQLTVRTADSVALATATAAQNIAANSLHRGPSGLYLEAPTLAEDHIVVSQLKPQPQDTGALKAIGWDDDDLPSKKSPFTVEQAQFLFALHESEHAMNKPGRSPVVPDGYDPKLTAQAKEIDADTAILKFLNDTGDKAGKEYFLQMRNVNSFKDALVGNNPNSDHDSATFLRVQDQTGQQIDLAKYATQKAGLIAEIRDRLNPVAMEFGTVKNSDIAGAVSDVLKDDQAHPERNMLTPLQRAEARQYLEDIKAVGYEVNPNYPKPSKDPEPPPPSPLQQNGPRLGS
ncbi:MAG TPA: hypothetical protein VL625_07800, partial [Patescibacteria group bacterium]|nr:hypothetical protein [Patescibacteria group bacterium]